MSKKIFFLILFAVLLALAVFLSGILQKGESGDTEDINVLLVTIDTIRADRIGAYGYTVGETPAIDSLAQKGVLFENCYAPVPLTLPSHCSILTGKYPIAHQVRNNGTYYLNEKEETLAEMFKESGYHTFAVIASFVLLSKFGLDQGFDRYDDTLRIKQMVRDFESQIPAIRIYDKFSQWLEKKGDEKFFAWVHLYDPHDPYEPPEEYKTRFPDNLSGAYDGEVAFVDNAIGKMVEDLKSAGLFHKTLIVVTGDHGEAFGEHKELGHSIFCYEESVRVPLIFCCPSLIKEAAVVPNRVSLIDIMPTLCDFLNVDIPQAVQGKSLVPFLEGQGSDEERTFYIESMYGKEEMGWAPLMGIIDGRYKYISLPQPELYDLEEDEGETTNLVETRGGVAEEMDRKLRQLLADFGTTGEGSRRKLSDKDIKHLEALGYVSPDSDKDGGNMDPKEGIGIKLMLGGLYQQVQNGDVDAVEAELKRITRENPEAITPLFYQIWEEVYAKRNDQPGAMRIKEKAIERFPENVRLKISLALNLYINNQLDEAEKLGLQVIEKDPMHSGAFIMLGQIEEKRHRPQRAGQYFEKAIQLEPQNIRLRVKYAKVLAGLRQQDRALEICRELLEEEYLKKNAEVRAKIGNILTEINQDDLAQQVLEGVLSFDQKNVETWCFLGAVYHRKKEYGRAERAYKKAFQLDNSCALAANNLGSLFLARFVETKDGDWMAKAIDAFTRAIQTDSEMLTAYLRRATAYRACKRNIEAIADWRRAIQIQPSLAEAYFNIAEVSIEIGKKDEARQILNLCKQRFYRQFPPKMRQRLDRLLMQAQ